MYISQKVGQVVWYSHLLKNFPQFAVIHTVKGFGLVKEVEVNVFLELSCFFDDTTDIGNLISGSSAFSKSTLNTWKLMVHVQLKPGLENTEHLLRPQDLKRSVFISIPQKAMPNHVQTTIQLYSFHTLTR